MNFSPQSGYDIALDIFTSLGLPVRDRNANLGEQLTQPGTSAAEYRQSQEVGIHPEHQVSMSHSALASQPWSTSYNSGLPTFTANVPPVVLSKPEDYFARQPIVHQNETRSYGMDRSWPASPSTLKSYPRPSKPFVPTLQSNATLMPRIHTSDGRLESQCYDSQAPFNSGIASQGTSFNLSTDPTCRTLFEQKSTEVRRPVTAPSPGHENSIDDLLPPRRVLPFPQPISKKVQIDLDVEKTKSNVPSKAEIVSATMNKVLKKRAPTKSKRGKSELAGGITKSTLDSFATINASGDRVDKHVKTTVGKLNRLSSATLRTPGEVLEIDKPQGSFEESNTKSQLGIKKLGSNALSDKSMTMVPNDAEISEEFTERVDDFIRRYGNHPAPVEAPKSDLAEYAAMPEEERLAALDAFILDLVCNNEDFGTLCSDVEKSWRRIGLGF